LPTQTKKNYIVVIFDSKWSILTTCYTYF
jgi:hypothetical protein